MRSPYCADETTPAGNTAFSRLGIVRNGGPRLDVRSPAAGAREDRTPDAFRPKSPNSAPEANGNARRRRPYGQPQDRVWRLAASVALVALLPAAHLARTAAQASGRARLLLQTVARRRFGAVRTVQSQAPKGLGQCSFELGYPAVLRGNQLHDFGRKMHFAVDFDSTFAVYPIFCQSAFSTLLWQIGLTAWELLELTILVTTPWQGT